MIKPAHMAVDRCSQKFLIGKIAYAGGVNAEKFDFALLERSTALLSRTAFTTQAGLSFPSS